MCPCSSRCIAKAATILRVKVGKAFVDLVGRGGATEIEKMRLEQIRKLTFQNSNNLKFIPHEEQKQ